MSHSERLTTGLFCGPLSSRTSKRPPKWHGPISRYARSATSDTRGSKQTRSDPGGNDRGRDVRCDEDSWDGPNQKRSKGAGT